MNRLGLLAAAASLAAVATIWSMLELAILSGPVEGPSYLAVLLSIVWGSSYAAGLSLGRILTRNPATWRLPFTISLALIALCLAYSLSSDISENLVGLLTVYSVVTLVLGILNNSTSKIAVETLPVEAWSEVALLLRGLVGVLHAMMSLLVGRLLLAVYGYDLEAAIEILAPLAVLGIVVAASSFRAPVIPETVLASLDKSIDSLVFGEATGRESISWTIVVIAAAASILKMLAIQDASSVKPEAALPVYAAFYTIGVLVGIRSSLGMISLEAFLGIVAASIAPDPILRLAAGVSAAGVGEAGLFYRALTSNPSRAGAVMLKVSLAAIAIGLLVEGLQTMLGFSYDDLLGAISVTVVLTGIARNRGPRWS